MERELHGRGLDGGAIERPGEHLVRGRGRANPNPNPNPNPALALA